MPAKVLSLAVILGIFSYATCRHKCTVLFNRPNLNGMTGNAKIKTLLATEDVNENRRGEIVMNRRPLMSPGSLGFVEGAVDLGMLQSDMLQDSYEDSRAELDAMGHNLVSVKEKIRCLLKEMSLTTCFSTIVLQTSVLMNPRETAMESLLDEFATKQTQSLQVTSSSSSSSSSTSSSFSTSFSPSSIMDMSMSMSSSMHSNSSSTHSMSASAHGAMASLSLFATTSSDMDQLKVETIIYTTL